MCNCGIAAAGLCSRFDPNDALPSCGAKQPCPHDQMCVRFHAMGYTFVRPLNAGRSHAEANASVQPTGGGCVRPLRHLDRRRFSAHTGAEPAARCAAGRAGRHRAGREQADVANLRFRRPRRSDQPRAGAGARDRLSRCDPVQGGRHHRRGRAGLPAREGTVRGGGEAGRRRARARQGRQGADRRCSCSAPRICSKRSAGTEVRATRRGAADQQAAGSILEAEANLQTAKINLGYTDIVSPIAGKIGRTSVTKGNVVGPDTGALTTIVSQDPMYVTFPVSQRDFLRAQQSRRAGRPAGAQGQAPLFRRHRIRPRPARINFVDVVGRPRDRHRAWCARRCPTRRAG